jgi:hydrogenase/urease accessory protein HupE
MKIKILIFLFFIFFGFQELLFAHITIEGGYSAINGFLHPIFSPAQVLTILSLGIFTRQQPSVSLKYPVISFLISMVMGMMLTCLSVVADMTPPLLLTAIALGIFIVIDHQFTLSIYVSLATIAGLLLGLDTEQQALVGQEKFATLVGSWIGLWACFACVINIHRKYEQKGLAKNRFSNSWFLVDNQCFFGIFIKLFFKSLIKI